MFIKQLINEALKSYDQQRVVGLSDVSHDYLYEQLISLKESLNKADRQLTSIFGKSLIDGRNSILKVLYTFCADPKLVGEIKKYKGLIIENFDCDSQLLKAVQVAAGNCLFYHIVETKEFAIKILNEFNIQKLPGELTLIPLDCIKPLPIPNYPKSSDAIPLISKLIYQKEYEIPLQHIFGRTLICRDFEIATRLANEFHLDCIIWSVDQAA